MAKTKNKVATVRTKANSPQGGEVSHKKTTPKYQKTKDASGGGNFSVVPSATGSLADQMASEAFTRGMLEGVILSEQNNIRAFAKAVNINERRYRRAARVTTVEGGFLLHDVLDMLGKSMNSLAVMSKQMYLKTPGADVEKAHDVVLEAKRRALESQLDAAVNVLGIAGKPVEDTYRLGSYQVYPCNDAIPDKLATEAFVKAMFEGVARSKKNTVKSFAAEIGMEERRYKRSSEEIIVDGAFVLRDLIDIVSDMLHQLYLTTKRIYIKRGSRPEEEAEELALKMKRDAIDAQVEAAKTFLRMAGRTVDVNNDSD